MKTALKKIFIFIFTILAVKGNSQPDTTSSGHYEGLSLKDLLNIKIVSVSKNQEFLFDAALSASVVTKEEIQRTGCTSIMEALRLVPGVIVREQSNGNYDIHLRGMDNFPPNASFDIASTTILVMINNRPIYSYLRGGTFWETLPVDINDVEKIEVIRGPAAALYGPNAVNGVINIITRQPIKDELYLVVNSQQGTNRSFINNASIGYKADKWDVIVSGNYQGRDRSQTSYFEFNRNQWLEDPDYFLNFTDDTIRNVEERFPEPKKAMEKYAGNLFFNYKAAKDVKFGLSAGMQHSFVQKASAENELTPLSHSVSDTKYADLRADIKGFSGQFSYNAGIQNVDFDPGNRFDFETFDANIEYNYTRDKFSLKPGVSYRKAVYDDTKYSDIIRKTGIFNTRGVITTKSASLRAEHTLLNNRLRLVAGLAISQFNYPDTAYLSSQVAATYKVNKDHLFRAVYSRAPRSSNIFDTYVDQTIAFFPTGPQNYTRLALVGDKNLKLLTADLFEIGYRGRLSATMNIDVEVFDIKARNSSVAISTRPYMHTVGADNITEIPIQVANLPARLHQQGITLSVNYSSKNLMIKPFVTVQRSRLKDYSAYHNTADAGLGPNHLYSGVGTEQNSKSTPAVFGGASVNYTPNEKVNINLSSYFYSAQSYYHLSNVLFNDGVRGIDNISGKVILNISVSYEPMNKFHIFLSAKNLLNDQSREFFHSDKVPMRLLGGFNYEF